MLETGNRIIETLYDLQEKQTHKQVKYIRCYNLFNAYTILGLVLRAFEDVWHVYYP